MAGRFSIRGDPAAEDSENSPENSSGDSPRSADAKIASTSSSRRSRRAIQKRVVSVPLKDVEGYRLKGDPMSTPPSDSWAWRKYGQKPIKGSPYPRGYYRCSSSKGCPARKQVERSRDDPQMLVVTYSCEHNHPWPAARNSHHRGGSSGAAAVAASGAVNMVVSSVSEEEEEDMNQLEEEQEEKKPVVVNNPSNDHQETIPDYKFKFIGNTEFGWLSDFESTTTTMLESPISAEDRIATDNEMAMIFAMRGEDEDESLFADLGELPECSTVFRRGMAAETPPSLATTI